MRPKGACSASLHCVGIAPYGGVQGVRTCNGSPSVKTFGFDTSATLRRTTQCEHWAASQREALKGRLAGGGLMPRRCRGIRGDEGIAPYGRATRVRSYDGGRTESSAPTEGCTGCLRATAGGVPQGRLFRFAPLRGHRPLRGVQGVRACNGGRGTPRVLVPLRSTAWASPPTEQRKGCVRVLVGYF